MKVELDCHKKRANPSARKDAVGRTRVGLPVASEIPSHWAVQAGQGLPNKRMNLTIQPVTARACARPAPG